MGRKNKAEVRRRQIVESCYRVIAEEGFEKATLKRIGKEMGVAPSLLMHYFKSKEDLILALVDYMVQKMDKTYFQASKGAKTARERLRLYIDKNFNFEIPQSVADRVFYGCFYMAIGDERICNSFRKMYKHDHRLIVKLITDYMEEEGIGNLLPDLLSIQIISYIEGFYLYRVIHGDTQELKEAVEGFKELLWKTLEGKKV
ncbi:MAG: hypothetical protein DRP87_11070 [Spirochaetes bacterium]|nr:MAG: hypothetical protein DRP87_11070 [Spirochaetota bacterium]